MINGYTKSASMTLGGIFLCGYGSGVKKSGRTRCECVQRAKTALHCVQLLVNSTPLLMKDILKERDSDEGVGINQWIALLVKPSSGLQ
jgi:hypothetical protein